MERNHEYMTREEARSYFEANGLGYTNIKEEDVMILIDKLKNSLALYLKEGGFHAEQMGMKVSRIRKKDIVCLKKGLKCAFIEIDGLYFKRREAVSFNSNGFIGFGGSLSDKNIQPVLKAFYEWCDYLKEKIECA